MKTKYQLAFTLSLIIFSLYSCRKDCKRAYKFELPIAIMPSDSLIQVGDTISIVIETSEHLRDVYSGNSYPVGKINFHTFLQIRKLEFDTAIVWQQPPAFNDFAVIDTSNGLLSWNSLEGRLNIINIDGRIQFSTQLIALKAGIYNIFFDKDMNFKTSEKHGAEKGIIPFSAEGEKCEGGIDSFHYIINDGQTHFDLLYRNVSFITNNNIEHPHYINLYKRSSFTIRVKD